MNAQIDSGSEGKIDSTSKHQPNAWLVRIGTDATLDEFLLRVKGTSRGFPQVEEGDGFLVVDEKAGGVVAFGRAYRVRRTLDEGTIFLDGAIWLPSSVDPGTLGVTLPASAAATTRLDWSIFVGALKTAAGVDFSTLPVIAGETPREQSYIRALLQMAVMDDLLGPADGPHEEIVEMSVRDRYLVGKLAPLGTEIPGEQIEELGGAGSVDLDEGAPESDASTSRSLVPSSFGLTFCVGGDMDTFEVVAEWGRYERGESERQADEKTGKPLRAWKRMPSGGRLMIPLREGAIGPVSVDAACPDVLLQGSVRPPLDNGDRLVTLFLVNAQTAQKQSQDEKWIFQPELVVRDPGGQAVFRRRPVLEADGSDEEREALEMIYRQRVEFAVGHGISVHAETSEDDPAHAIEIRTRVLPSHEVPVTETPGLGSGGPAGHATDDRRGPPRYGAARDPGAARLGRRAGDPHGRLRRVDHRTGCPHRRRRFRLRCGGERCSGSLSADTGTLAGRCGGSRFRRPRLGGVPFRQQGDGPSARTERLRAEAPPRRGSRSRGSEHPR